MLAVPQNWPFNLLHTHYVGVVTLHTMEAVAASWNGFDFQIMGMASQTAKEVWFFGIQTTGAKQFDLKMVWKLGSQLTAQFFRYQRTPVWILYTRTGLQYIIDTVSNLVFWSRFANKLEPWRNVYIIQH